MYYRMITVIDAQDRIVDIKVGLYSQTADKEFKTKFYNDLTKKAYPNDSEKVISPMEMVQKLKQGS